MREFDFIQRLLPEICAFILNNYGDRSSLNVSTKRGVADLVTEADTQAQHRVEAAILAEFPGDLLVAEESGRDKPPTDLNARCWVCDPIDGTHNFARGMIAGWGVSLAFVEGGEVLAGGVFMPGLHEMFLAEHGRGATRNGKPIRVSNISEMPAARIEFDYSHYTDRQSTLALCGDILQHAGQLRCHGAAVVGLCTVACGAAEAYIHGGLNPWDFAAAMHIIREAGGRVTRLDGNDVRVFDGLKGMIASNGAIHENILAGIRATRPG